MVALAAKPFGFVRPPRGAAAPPVPPRRKRKAIRTPKHARREFLRLCERVGPRGSRQVFVSPEAARYLMKMTDGHVVPEMWAVAGIAPTAAGDNVFLRLCGRVTVDRKVEAMIDAAILFSRKLGCPEPSH